MERRKVNRKIWDDDSDTQQFSARSGMMDTIPMRYSGLLGYAFTSEKWRWPVMKQGLNLRRSSENLWKTDFHSNFVLWYTTYLTRIDNVLCMLLSFYSRSQKLLQNQMCSVMSLLVTIHRSHWILLMNLILVFSCLQWFLVYASVSVACPKVRQKLHWAVFSGAREGRKRNCCRVQVKDHVSVLWCWC